MSSSDSWEIYQDKKGEWRWKRTSPNGNRVGASSEGYSSRTSCIANARRNGYGDGPKVDVSKDKWELYEDKKGGWRWRRTAVNGNVVGSATESYHNRGDCLANARRHGYKGS